MNLTQEESSFKSFQGTFRGLIAVPTFGEPLRYKQRAGGHDESPASKEIRTTGLLQVLNGDEFCVQIRQLMEQYHKLETQRLRTLEVAHKFPQPIRRYRSGSNSLEKCRRILEEFNEKYCDLLDHKLSGNIGAATKLIDGVAFEFGRRAQILASNIHPSLRRMNYETSDRELLIKEYDDNLEKKLGIKATDQWFWSSVNLVLLEFIERNKIGNISAMTRFKLIAAINEAAGHGVIPHTTVKQFFFEYSRRKPRPL